MNKIIIYIVALVFLGGCAINYAYLPEAKKIARSPYGSYIKVYKGYNPIAKGEFLALDGDTIVIRTDNKPFLSYIDTSEVSTYYIQYCNTKNYGYLPLIAISHGWWMVFTVPINIIAAIVLKERDKKDSRFYDLPYNQASAYARYPQGLPEGYTYQAESYNDVKW